MGRDSSSLPQYPGPGQPLDAALPSACTAELAVHVDYTASDTKVYLHISPFTVHIPSWVSGMRGEGRGNRCKYVVSISASNKRRSRYG